MAIYDATARTGWARRPCTETVLVGAVCLVDLLSTLVLLSLGLATEANPLMAHFLDYGIGAFCAAKLLFTVPPLLVAEWYRQHNERLVRNALRFVLAAYVASYALGVFVLNADVLPLPFM